MREGQSPKTANSAGTAEIGYSSLRSDLYSSLATSAVPALWDFLRKSLLTRESENTLLNCDFLKVAKIVASSYAKRFFLLARPNLKASFHLALTRASVIKSDTKNF